MRSNPTNKNQDLPRLLTEDFADGTFAPFLQSVQGSLKNFGDTISSAAKLIGSDVALLINLTFGRLKKNSDLRSMMSSYRGQRTRYIDQVLQNGNKAMESWPDSKITAMLAAPSLFFTTETLSGMGNMFSPTFRQEIGQYGPSLLPGIGAYFEGNRSTAMNNIFGHWNDVDYTDEASVNRAWAKSMGALSGNDGADLLNDKKKDRRNILTKMAEKITDMFLIAHHEVDGSLLSEGEEKEEVDIDPKAL